MNDLIVLDGKMDFGGEEPEEGQYVQVNEYDARIVEVDEEERLVFVDVDECDYLQIYSY